MKQKYAEEFLKNLDNSKINYETLKKVVTLGDKVLKELKFIPYYRLETVINIILLYDNSDKMVEVIKLFLSCELDSRYPKLSDNEYSYFVKILQNKKLINKDISIKTAEAFINYRAWKKHEIYDMLVDEELIEKDLTLKYIDKVTENNYEIVYKLLKEKSNDENLDEYVNIITTYRCDKFSIKLAYDIIINNEFGNSKNNILFSKLICQAGDCELTKNVYESMKNVPFNIIEKHWDSILQVHSDYLKYICQFICETFNKDDWKEKEISEGIKIIKNTKVAFNVSDIYKLLINKKIDYAKKYAKYKIHISKFVNFINNELANEKGIVEEGLLLLEKSESRIVDLLLNETLLNNNTAITYAKELLEENKTNEEKWMLTDSNLIKLGLNKKCADMLGKITDDKLRNDIYHIFDNEKIVNKLVETDIFDDVYNKLDHVKSLKKLDYIKDLLEWYSWLDTELSKEVLLNGIDLFSNCKLNHIKDAYEIFSSVELIKIGLNVEYTNIYLNEKNAKKRDLYSNVMTNYRLIPILEKIVNLIKSIDDKELIEFIKILTNSYSLTKEAKQLDYLLYLCNVCLVCDKVYKQEYINYKKSTTDSIDIQNEKQKELYDKRNLTINIIINIINSCDLNTDVNKIKESLINILMNNTTEENKRVIKENYYIVYNALYNIGKRYKKDFETYQSLVLEKFGINISTEEKNIQDKHDLIKDLLQELPNKENVNIRQTFATLKRRNNKS